MSECVCMCFVCVCVCVRERERERERESANPGLKISEKVINFVLALFDQKPF